MTREGASKLFLDGKKCTEIFDMIFADCASRTCENCKHDNTFIECVKKISRPAKFISLRDGWEVEQDFGCNKFQPKQ